MATAEQVHRFPWFHGMQAIKDEKESLRYFKTLKEHHILYNSMKNVFKNSVLF